jgi:hypothetical protein
MARPPSDIGTPCFYSSVACVVGPSVNTFFIFHIFKIENFEIWQFEHTEGTQLNFPSKPNFCILLKLPTTKFTQKSIPSTSKL